MTMLAALPDTDTLRSALDGIRADINALVERRANLMTEAVAELTAHGIDTFVLHDRRRDDAPDLRGRQFPLWQRWSISGNGRVNRRLSRGCPGDERRGPTIDAWGDVSGVLTVVEVLVDDGDTILVARVPIDPHEESGHRRAVARVRRYAAEIGLRVKLRDRDVSLIDHTGEPVHVGDVWTAALWLAGIDPTEAEVES